MLKPSSRDPVYQPIHFWGFFGLQVASALRSPMKLARLKIQDLKIDNRKNYYEPRFRSQLSCQPFSKFLFVLRAMGKCFLGRMRFLAAVP